MKLINAINICINTLEKISQINQHTHIHTYIHTYIQTDRQTDTNRQMCLQTYIHNAYTHVHICTYLLCVYIEYLSTCVYIYMAGIGGSGGPAQAV